MITYEKTGNPNIVKEIKSSETEIHLDKLERDVLALQEQIDTLPKPKTKPDQETLDFYNVEIGMHGEKEMSEMQLKEKQDLRDILTSIREAETWM